MITVQQLFNVVDYNDEIYFIDDNSGAIFDQEAIDFWDGDKPLDQYNVVNISAFPYNKKDDNGRALYITVSEY